MNNYLLLRNKTLAFWQSNACGLIPESVKFKVLDEE